MAFSATLQSASTIARRVVRLVAFVLPALVLVCGFGISWYLSSTMRTEIERDMKLMGCTSISQLSRENLRFR